MPTNCLANKLSLSVKALFVFQCDEPYENRWFSPVALVVSFKTQWILIWFLKFLVQGKQPNFIQKFGHRTLQEGEDLILHCIIHGKPKPHVYWTKDDIQVVSGDISVCSNVLEIFLGRKVIFIAWHH